jgi:hypothetical protein
LLLLIAACLVAALPILYFYNRHRGKIDAENGTRKTLAAWASTMLSNDLAGQVGCYGPIVEPFFQQPTVTIQVIADEKAKLMKAYPLVKQYAISNIDFAKIEPDIVKVSLDKTWDVQGIRQFAGSEREVLTLRQFDGQWKIVAETEAKIYWVRTK